jgi:Fe-S oxidoreductase
MSPLFMSLLIIAALAIFSHTMYRKFNLLMALEPVQRTDRIMDRLKSVLVFALGQKRLVGRKKEFASGLMHAFIFWGFCVLLIRSIQLYGEGFVHGFELPLINQDYLIGYLYIGLKDIMEGIVLIMALYAIFRRAVLRPERLHNTWEAYFVLGMILVLMISDLLLDGARYNMVFAHANPDNIHFFNNPDYGNEFSWTPVAFIASYIIEPLSADATRGLMQAMFWLHIITQLTFLNFLPLGKHFHVITSLPNVFLKSLDYPHEKAKVLDLEDEDAWENETLGMNHIHQLDRKQALDLYTCTECGRCKEVCPAYITDKPLNLYDFNQALKHELFDNADKIIQRKNLSLSLAAESDEEAKEEIKAEMLEQMAKLNSEKTLVGDVIAEDTLWSCTTCRACEEVCPVTIEHVPRIVAMRQGQTLMAESYPKEINTALKGLERNGNPWGLGYDKRADWAEGLGVKTMAEDSNVDYLLWVGCAGSFDDRTKKVSVALVQILQKAGINFAILGKEEKCTGDFARRAGNEMMYQMMALENIETLNNYKVKKIITACPHCLNTLKHEYPQMGGVFEVIHHSEFIRNLVQSGKITLNKSFEGQLTYHDPCYLGRYNNVYSAPRSLLKSLAKGGFTELDRHSKESFCCGAGGARMWMEENIGKRINLERAEEIIGKTVSNVAVGCPFCLTMIEDGMKELGREDEIKTKDIAELVANNMIEK